VHRKPGKHRKPAKHRKPPKRTFAVVGATAVATVAVASGVASAAPDGQAHPATPAQPAHSGERAGVAQANVSSQLAAMRGRLATAETHTLLAQEQRLAAARLAAKRRAAARRAAALAAQQAAQQAAQRAAQPPASPAPSSATPSGSPQQIAMAMLGSFGWSSSQFGCLQSLWNRESGWNPSATNPTSGAYGITQALPGDKMASAGADWQTNPATQIRWGLGYIQQVYGSPCAAWSHEEAVGSY
jgi:Transglycosylase SLT domain